MRRRGSGVRGTGQSPEGCPFIEFAFTYYEGQSAARLNRDLPRFLGDGPRPTTAAEYISAIAERVRASVQVWSQTGALTGVPRGLLLAGMELPGIQGAGTKVARGAVQLKARSGGARHPGDPAAVREALGAGSPLEGGLRSRMESAFGRSFSHVRVHTDGTAASLSDRFNARAFTVGEHVGFGATEYRPATFAGDALIAHELAHVVQQDGAVATSQSTDSKQATLEADADRSAAATIVHLWRGLRGGLSTLPRRAVPRLKTGLGLQRCKKGKCVVKSGPTYTPSGTQTPATSGGNKTVPFDFTAVFEHDPSKDINASCCWVRQNIKWDAAFATHYGKPPHKGFPSSAASGTLA